MIKSAYSVTLEIATEGSYDIAVCSEAPSDITACSSVTLSSCTVPGTTDCRKDISTYEVECGSCTGIYTQISDGTEITTTGISYIYYVENSAVDIEWTGYYMGYISITTKDNPNYFCCVDGETDSYGSDGLIYCECSSQRTTCAIQTTGLALSSKLDYNGPYNCTNADGTVTQGISKQVTNSLGGSSNNNKSNINNKYFNLLFVILLLILSK